MKKLIEQILKFGVVGVVCFLIDFLITMGLSTLLRSVAGMPTGSAALVGAFFGFTISVIVNYLLSMRYVFTRREDIGRKREFTVFLILSVIGLLVNEFCMFVGMDIIYGGWKWLQGIMSFDFAKNWFFKFGATGVVMVYNFITRKLFLEQKQDQETTG